MSIKYKIYIFTVAVLLAVLPSIVNARVIITEIMYDPAGADTGREWIEIYNDGADAVDMTTLRIFENNVAHTMKPHVVPSALLLANTYAIVADNPERFLIDFPTYSGLLIDSVFSLNNTGELVNVQSSDGVIDYSVTYTFEWGALSTGNSLQLYNDAWIPGAPTVGASNVAIPANENGETEENQNATTTSASSGSGGSGSGSSSNSNSNTTNSESNSSSNSNQTSTHTAQVQLSSYKPKPKFEVTSGRDRYGFVHTPIAFEAVHNQEKNSGIKFRWSLGDGAHVFDRKIEHTYIYEGEYNMVLTAAQGNNHSVSRNKVFIRKPDIAASLITRGELVDIMLENRGEFEVNIGLYKVVLQGADTRDIFEIAPDTIIASKSHIVIPNEISGLQSRDSIKSIQIYYPDGFKMLDVVSI